MLASAPSVLRFDAFALDTLRCVLMRGASELPLRRQSFDVLRYLAEHAGNVVSSEELVQSVWVSKPADHNSSVGQCIKEIRRALGDDGRWIIKTVSGRGYEFKAEVVRAEVPQPRTPPALSLHPHAAPAKATTWRWLQPFALLGSRRQQALVAAIPLFTVLAVGGWLIRPSPQPASPIGLTMMAAPTIELQPFSVLGALDHQSDVGATLFEDLRSELPRAPRGFDMVIRSSADYGSGPLAPASNASSRGVRYIVFGTTWLDKDVQYANVRLVEAETGRQIWAEPFEFAPGQLDARNRMAARIARLLTVHVRKAESQRPLPDTPEAGHFALRGHALLEFERDAKLVLEAQTLFEKALALDANSLPALHGIARAKLILAINGWISSDRRPAALAEAGAAIERMIRLDDRYVAAHSLRGSLLRVRRDVDHAMAAFERALTLNPNYMWAHAELGRTKIEAGRAHEALAHIETALRLSPTDPLVHVWYFWAGMAALHIADYQAAVQWLLKARQANRSYALSVQLLAVAYHGLGEFEKAKALMAEYLHQSANFTIARWSRIFVTDNPIVAEQRKRIEEALRGLGVPEGDSVTGQH